MVARVKKNDTVSVLTGKDKGKVGTVLEIVLKKKKVRVKGVAVVTKHAKARKAGDIAGIRKEESLINLSNVMPVCTSCNKPCRIQAKKFDHGKKVRVCGRCKEIF